MVGSSNFTAAGMGVGRRLNTEANLLTVVDHESFSREPGRLEAIWPVMEQIDDPATAEWLGAQPDRDEEEQAASPPVPPGFLHAVYHAASPRRIVLSLEPSQLPPEWRIEAVGRDAQEVLSSAGWHASDQATLASVPWTPVQPPQMLLVRWAEHEAFLPLNVEDQAHLPPAHLEGMSAEDMLGILAASDPSAAFRVWLSRLKSEQEEDLDSAVPTDLDPLRRFDLHATFLHRVRRRAKVLTQMRSHLERPVGGRQALEWRLRGLIGIEAVGDRFAREFAQSDGHADESLLTLADFLIVLREVQYQPENGSLQKHDFEEIFRPFLRDLTVKLSAVVDSHRDRVSNEPTDFWKRVVDRCRE
jgi:hypothetical protein